MFSQVHEALGMAFMNLEIKADILRSCFLLHALRSDKNIDVLITWYDKNMPQMRSAQQQLLLDILACELVSEKAPQESAEHEEEGRRTECSETRGRGILPRAELS